MQIQLCNLKTERMNFPTFQNLPPEVQADIQERKLQHERLLAELEITYTDEATGFFGPGSMTWKLYREPCVIIGSSRALLLQIAHPAIADGVKQYSNFQKEMAKRAHRTFTTMSRIWFGDKTTAINSAKRLHNIHSMIRGTAAWEIEDETIYKPYCAADPDLLFWVLATLIDTTIVATEKVMGQLPLHEKKQFYEESKISAQLMGIPPEVYPPDLEGFYERYQSMIDSETLCVGTSGKEISAAIFKLPFPLKKLLKIMAGGLLPTNISKQFGLEMTKFSGMIFNFIIAASKGFFKLTPATLRYAPAFHQANYRIKKVKGDKASFIEKMHHWLGKNVNLYFISNKLDMKTGS